MSKINLLPWRDEVKKIQNRIYIGFLISVVLMSFLVVSCIHIVITHKISAEQNNITYLENEKNKLKDKIAELIKIQETKRLLLNQIRIIQMLQNDRISIPKLLDIIARSMAEGVYLTELNRRDVVILPKEIEVSKTNINSIDNTLMNTHTPANADINSNIVANHSKILMENLYKQNNIQLMGIAQSNAAITVLLKNLEQESWFNEVKLTEVTRDKNGIDLNFKIDVIHKLTEANK